MTLEATEQVRSGSGTTSAMPDRYADTGDESAVATAAAARTEWQRVRDQTASTLTKRYDPDHDLAVQRALCVERHRRDTADRATEAASRTAAWPASRPDRYTQPSTAPAATR